MHQINMDFLKKPVITEKATKLLEQKQYIFDVDPKLTKTQIKKILQFYYGKKIQSLRTYRRHLKQYGARSAPTKRVVFRFCNNQEIQIFTNVQNN